MQEDTDRCKVGKARVVENTRLQCIRYFDWIMRATTCRASMYFLDLCMYLLLYSPFFPDEFLYVASRASTWRYSHRTAQDDVTDTADRGCSIMTTQTI